MQQNETNLVEDPCLWFPQAIETTQVGAFIQYINETQHLKLTSYNDLYTWSIQQTALFWKSLWDFTAPLSSGTYKKAVSNEAVLWPTPTWFEGITLNFAENLLNAPDNHLAIIFQYENGKTKNYSYKDLKTQVAYLANWMKHQGIQSGDVIAGFMPNCPEAVTAMLAATSLGAIWTSCSPDSGTQFAIDRFEQTQPKLLFSVDCYLYDNKQFDITDKLQELTKKLTCLSHLVIVKRNPTVTHEIPKSISYESLITSGPQPELTFTRLPFSHPIYSLYSSGTTGKPKAIVHSAGGTLLQHLKEHRLQCNLYSQDKLFYYTTTSWMMWNWLVSALASDITIVLFEGKPDATFSWNMVRNLKITAFGTSAPWISLSQKSKFYLPENTLPDLKLILSTGAPLLREHFDYIYTHIKKDVQLSSISGGTDIVSCFAGAGPVPVKRGRLQCVGLGMPVDVWDENGNSVRNEQGELVCTKPFPCMPIYFLHDKDNEKYKAAYFEKFDGIWAHGDFAILYDDNSLEIIGRSDSTIKRHGVRIGTSDIYNALEQHPQIDDVLAAGKRAKDNEDIVLFVKLKSDNADKIQLKKDIRNLLIAQSPWLKPDYVFFVQDIPYTSNGKKSEVLVKNLLNGKAVTNLGVLRNPDCITDYKLIADSLIKT
ncbi:MAG: acetoacetate--CoA ligase [Candidatus Margulisbacteria bacterium]|nr:acetoacetate--CoA ligase [Candidatus Margulisiibacteriota bacterium]